MDNQNARQGYKKHVVMKINIVLQTGFKNWLETLGYAEKTVYTSTNYVRDFFQWLGKNNIKELDHINNKIIVKYYNHLRTRKNKRLHGGLSASTIFNNVSALKTFSRYLQKTGKKPIPINININLRRQKTSTKPILTTAEIKAMYKACENNYLGIRDRAILSIYYGCGLRRSEGAALDLSDVLLKKKLLYIRSGKGYKERYMPFNETVKEDLENYIYVARDKLKHLKNVKTEALLLSNRGKRMSGCALITRVQKLAEEARINKTIGLHFLRHTIATHLLQSGMELEDISRFLGHSGLESTQIYTHIVNE